MKELTTQEADAIQLEKTHTIFWDTDITGDTEKAFRIHCMNSKGAWHHAWIPKSRTSFLMIRDTRKRQHPAQYREKYFIPKFFTK